MTSILVTGGNGQLGSELRELSAQYKNWQFIFTDVEELDITSKDALESFIDSHHFDFIINCAAYTNVDAAEEDKENAHLLNAIAIKNIAELSVDNSIVPIHISTDYVFAGKNHKPYSENDVVQPVGIYGKTKMEGEELLRTTCPNHIIIRTSWLYSPFGKNFLKTMLNLGKAKDELGVIVDQIGTPTYAKDLAETILKIVDQLKSADIFSDFGTYHYSNEGVCSWYDFATEIQQLADNNCKINAIESKDFFTLAKRPHYSVLNKSKIKHIFDLEIPHWRTRVKHCIERIKS